MQTSIIIRNPHWNHIRHPALYSRSDYLRNIHENQSISHSLCSLFTKLLITTGNPNVANCIVNTHLRFLKFIFNETDAVPGQFLPSPTAAAQPAAARSLKNHSLWHPFVLWMLRA